MTEELWDELGIEMVKAIRTHPRSYCETIFAKVKAEGDRLKDELQRYKNSFHIIKLAGGKEVEFAQKLADIKIYIGAQAKGTRPAYEICVGVLSLLEADA